MAKRIQDGKLLYHMTSLDNLENIFRYGLLSRNEAIKQGLLRTDIANQEIVSKRQELHIDDYIPFHFFEKTPFAGAVIRDNPDKDFCYIAITREFAQKNNFKIRTAHPLSSLSEVCNWDDGFNKIKWDLMNKRDYTENDCKNVCMAEALAVSPLACRDFFSIFVKDFVTVKQVEEIATRILNNYTFEIWENKYFFTKRTI